MKPLIAKIITISGLFIIPSIWAWQLTNTPPEYIHFETNTNDGGIWIKSFKATNWNFTNTYRIQNFSSGFNPSVFMVIFPSNYINGTALSNLDEVRAWFYKQKPIVSKTTNERGYWVITFEPVK